MISTSMHQIDFKSFRGTTKFLRKRRSEAVDESSGSSNEYLREVKKLRRTIPEWDNFFEEDASEQRGNHWIRLEILGQPLLEKYSWAIPDATALNVLANFQPLIEIGAGSGYWAHLLHKRGVQIRAYDRFVASEKNRWTTVLKGGSVALEARCNVGRTLFLCYPDESCDLAWSCLQRYNGEYLVHVGELLTTGTLAGGPQSPFGRTSGSRFQMELITDFHCVYSHRLPNFPFGNDYITVWKRKVWVVGRSGRRDDLWSATQPIRCDSATPQFAHLLPPPNSSEGDDETADSDVDESSSENES